VAGQHRLARPEITFHCRHRHPLRSVDPQVPLQGSELKAASWSDQDLCRLTRIEPRIPIPRA
jgi:hypothetical protein